MFPARPHTTKRAYALPVLALLAGVCAAALMAYPATAQQASGRVDDQDMSTDALTKKPLAARRSALHPASELKQDQIQGHPAYQAITPPADEPVDAESDSIFQGIDGGTEPTAAGARRPSTAQRRTSEARDRASGTSSAPARRTPSEQDDTLTTGTVRARTVDSENDLALDKGAERVEAIEGLDRDAEENPYAPLGLRLGTFTVTPTLETGLTATSNADSSANGKSAILSETTLRLNAVSDWVRHSASLEAYGTLRQSISGADLDEKEAGIKASGIYEIDNELRAVGSLGYVIRPESASSPVVIEGTASRPVRQTVTAGLGLQKDLGKLRLSVLGNVERDFFGDAELSSGGTLSQRERDSTLATVKLRGGYEISPALTPFAEVEIGRRNYDEKLDASGFQRSADRLGARAGVALDLGEKFGGEFSAGWLREELDDERLAAISGLTLNADLKWSPERGTTVGLAANTTVEGTTTAGESGSVLHAAKLSVDRELRANLTANAAIGASYRDYASTNGHDTILSAEAGATYWFNRYMGLVGRARHEQLKSNLPGRDSQTNSVFLGVKLQR
ncbi:outer membrane beta-barrel protein [Mesorhizobium sp. NBSH29]|uniref:outer membrane beta-barrel protein n=1 Tax=Mesorhizobium sp. NBSH29 TaxID=2654249 RepID=UPI001896569E|nr:outer membrane beta-barrel protein [Mesorhizobium sp. NBSH29]QPC88445.1 outer membrane beta-barrel protein [Mesorhizobium sp. NBSH29]